ncbi:YIP1 family protein [Haploplasma axanthum]|uniref:Yip1 domain n=1 Tax=Haploplasma axanthum TaxID=29552 RepID=A0A449BBH5_HAPAX|nr:YIP1 family protein [Haploplasma axanthum]VEU79775.1 Yip1 domain [Haploplasma axanthum]
MSEFKLMLKNLNLKDKAKIFFNDIIIFPLYILTHPIKGFDELKTEKKGKMYVAVFYLIMMIMALTYSETSTGFLMNPLNKNEFNLGKTILLVVLPVLLAVVGNWSVTSLLDGKGKMTEIFMIICYGLIPYIWFSIPLTFFSKFITTEEIAFYNAFVGISVFLSGYMIFMGLLVIHEYGLAKTILTIIFTIVAIAIIVFIGILFLTLIQQVYGFLESVYREFILRIS